MFRDFAEVECPSPGLIWIGASDEKRMELVSKCIQRQSKFDGFKVLRTSTNGNVTVNFPAVLGANQRGTLLLDLEESLKNEIDNGIVVWCDPLGDKSTLRNLRGIQIRS
jgi:hypothetical protein